MPSDFDGLLDRNVDGLKNYVIHEHLGSGATSDVFRVTCKENNKIYVLKQISLRGMSDEEQLRVKQEILVLNGFDHPNVVKFRESFSGRDSVDIVMEYCECGTLESLIERQMYEGRPFSGEELIEWMAELLCALAQIHSKRILHRDIKSSNVFVTAKNHLKLGDFGVCTPLASVDTQSDKMIGTPLYFAPEVCEGCVYDERSDIWSLGVVFYEMCTLRLPFEAENLFSLIHKIVSEDVAPFNTGLDSAFEMIVRKMLSKNPNDRLSAQELMDDYLEVPVSHPSHPSQKPSRGRLIQRCSGPVLHYTKPWPPAKNEAAALKPFNPAHDKAEWLPSESARNKLYQMKQTTRGINKFTVLVPTLAARSTTTAPSTAVHSAKPNPPLVGSPLEISSAAASTQPTGHNEENGNHPIAISNVRKDISRKRSLLFGEPETPVPTTPVVVELDPSVTERLRRRHQVEGRLSSRPASSPSAHNISVQPCISFSEEVAEVLRRHTRSGRVVGSEQLDKAIKSLTRYKQKNCSS